MARQRTFYVGSAFKLCGMGRGTRSCHSQLKGLRADIEILAGQTPGTRTDIEVLVKNLKTPIGIALDLKWRKIYFTELEKGRVMRANLDGTQLEEVVSGLKVPTGIAFAEY